MDLAVQKKRLEEKKAELEQSIADLTEAHPTPVSSTDADEGSDHEDIATDFEEIQKEQSILVNEQALLTLVNNALQRLADGTYGICLECGRPIPEARLQAIPWAERDVQCEEIVEKRNLSREEDYTQQTF